MPLATVTPSYVREQLVAVAEKPKPLIETWVPTAPLLGLTFTTPAAMTGVIGMRTDSMERMAIRDRMNDNFLYFISFPSSFLQD